MQKLFILLTLIAFTACNSTDDNEMTAEKIFAGDVFMKTQTDVDNFAAEAHTQIKGSLFFTSDSTTGNDHITDLSALNTLNQIQGRLVLTDIQFLNSLEGLQNISHTGGLMISNCGGLTNLDGLLGLTRVEDEEGTLNEQFNDRDTVFILGNTHLNSLNGLRNLTSVPSLVVYANYNVNGIGGLESLDGLESLQIISGTRVYDANGNLEEIRKYIAIGTAGVDTSGGNIYLNDFCALRNLFANGVFDPNDVNIDHNLYNPSVQDIIGGNCSG